MPAVNGDSPANFPTAYASSAQLLPGELWTLVLSQLRPSELQHAALALSRALPHADGTGEIKDLYRHIVVSRDTQAPQLVVKLRRLDDAGKGDRKKAQDTAVSLTGLAWRTDSNVLVNLVSALPLLQAIDLHVGPLFAPEHLEELVELRRPSLRRLSLRFNPYLDRASYTMFLKGIYFDTGVLQFARWPITPGFRQLSLIQDPIPSLKDLVEAALESGLRRPDKTHAQPIVFFKLSCLSTLATAPIAAHLTSVRLRVPSRGILTAMSTASTAGGTVIPATHSATLPKPFPALEHLDISTTYVNCDAALQGLLKRHPGLRHLVVDRSGLIRFGMPEQTCAEIGKLIATIGVSRATEAMKVYKAAARAQNARLQLARQQQQHALAMENANGHLAAPNALERLVNAEVNTSRRGRSSYATERRSRQANTAAAESLDSLAEAFAGTHISAATKPIILPSAPSLVSLACGVGPHPELDEALREDWDDEFHAGWEEGIDKVITHLNDKMEEFDRLRIRAQNATHKSTPEDRMFPRLYRFRTPEERKDLLKKAAASSKALEDLEEYKSGDILASMDLVPCDEIDVKQLIDEIRSSTCTLCTLPDCAAEGRIVFTENSEEKDEKERIKWRRPESEHMKGCAHLVGRRIWEEKQDVFV